MKKETFAKPISLWPKPKEDIVRHNCGNEKVWKGVSTVLKADIIRGYMYEGSIRIGELYD